MGQFRFYFGISVFWLAISMISDGLHTLVLPDYLLSFTKESQQATVLGIFTFFGLMFGMLVQPVAGAWSDRQYHRWGRRGTIGLGVFLSLAALLLLWLSPSLPLIFASYLLLQGVMSLAQAAQQGFIPDLVPVNRRGTAAGLKGFMDIGGALLGFILLGGLLGTGDIGAALAAMALVLVICYGFTVWTVEEPRSPAVHAAPIPLKDTFNLDLHQHSVFVHLVAVRFLFLLGIYSVGRFLLYFVADRLHLDRDAAAEQAGGLLAVLTLITVIAAPLTGWLADYLGRRFLMFSGALLSATGILLLIPADSSGLILLAGGMMALGSAAFTGANWAMTADVTPPQEAARFLAIANFGTAGAAATAGLFGLLVDQAGYPLLFIASALACASSVVVLRQIPQNTGLTQTPSVPALPEVEHS